MFINFFTVLNRMLNQLCLNNLFEGLMHCNFNICQIFQSSKKSANIVLFSEILQFAKSGQRNTSFEQSGKSVFFYFFGTLNILQHPAKRRAAVIMKY